MNKNKPSTLELLKEDAKKLLETNASKEGFYLCDNAGCLGRDICPIKQAGFRCVETR